MNSAIYTPTITKLIADAQLLGLCITERELDSLGSSTLHIFRPKAYSKISLGVRLYLHNGAFAGAHRTDVPLDLANGIRTIKQVRSILLGGK